MFRKVEVVLSLIAEVEGARQQSHGHREWSQIMKL
jgi:hypothetical protein